MPTLAGASAIKQHAEASAAACCAQVHAHRRSGRGVCGQGHLPARRRHGGGGVRRGGAAAAGGGHRRARAAVAADRLDARARRPGHDVRPLLSALPVGIAAARLRAQQQQSKTTFLYFHLDET